MGRVQNQKRRCNQLSRANSGDAQGRGRGRSIVVAQGVQGGERGKVEVGGGGPCRLYPYIAKSQVSL